MKEAFDLFQEVFKGYQLHNFAIWLYVARYMIKTDKERAVKDSDNDGRFKLIESDVKSNKGNIKEIRKTVSGIGEDVVKLKQKFEYKKEGHAKG